MEYFKYFVWALLAALMMHTTMKVGRVKDREMSDEWFKKEREREQKK